VREQTKALVRSRMMLDRFWANQESIFDYKVRFVGIVDDNTVFLFHTHLTDVKEAPSPFAVIQL